jgi:hypothetical protein
MSEQGTKAQAQNHKQNGWKEPPQTKSNTPAPITNEMLDIVLACYFSNPVAFAAHTHDLPFLFTGRRRTLIDIHNHLLVELSGVTLESVAQEARQRLGADEAKVEKLQEHIDVIASVDVEQETPYVLSRVAAWINERVQERAATRYLEARERTKADPSEEARQELKAARQQVFETALGIGTSLVIESDSELLKAKIPEAEPVIEGLLDAGMVGLFGASSKSYKTWVTMMLACGVGYTETWLGFKCRKGRVLYLNFELTRKSAQKRLEALYKRLDIKPNGMIEMVQLKGAELEPEAIMNTLIHRCRLKDYVLIIIDPLYVFEGGKAENSNDEMGLLMLRFISLAAKTGTAVWICHHFSKGNQALKDLLDRFAGVGALGRAIDSAVGMTPHEEHKDGKKVYSMEFEVRNHTEIEPFVVRWDYPIMVEAPELNAADLKQAKKGANEQYSDQDFVHHLPVAGLDEPLSYSKWMTAVMSATGMKSEDTFKKRRKKLVEAGKVVQVDGRYARPAPAVGKVPPAEPER